jgi:IS605 OrfB family transposase
VRRACVTTLKFATAKKRRAINALLQAHRAAVNFYIESLWNTRGNLDKQTLERLSSDNTRLLERYKSNALKQALSIIISTKKSAKATKKSCNMPIFRGDAVLDAKFVAIESSKNLIDFDLVIRLSSLKKRSRIIIPTKKTKNLNKWLNFENDKIIHGCSLSEDKLTLWIDIPDREPKSKGKNLGVDIGVNKILTTSEGQFIGTEFKELRQKIQRKQKGSKAYNRVLKDRNNYLNCCVNKLPWSEIKFLAVEDLKNLKKGKSHKRGKTFRKAMIPWSYRQVIEALKNKAEENRVYLQKVEPAYTSQICPNCSKVSSSNRKNEDFRCISCDFRQDADIVGAYNILVRALRLVGSVESPTLLKSLAEMNINSC